MKLYTPEPAKIIRLQIVQKGQKTYCLNFSETTQLDVLEMLKQLINKQKFDTFSTLPRISLNVREAIGSQNGKSKTLSFNGSTTEKIYDLIINQFKK